MQRGHNREPCFFAEDDFFSYLHWLREALAETRCTLHAYALMTNHVHLLLTPQTTKAVPKLLISLSRRYVQYINRTYRRTGTLWDSRYKSSLGTSGDLPAHRPALHRAQPRACGDGGRPGADLASIRRT